MTNLEVTKEGDVITVHTRDLLIFTGGKFTRIGAGGLDNVTFDGHGTTTWMGDVPKPWQLIRWIKLCHTLYKHKHPNS